MQKKSLLVALFCGALCLTGCLKNEESASVAQVRIAKANELNSLADLNKAKAAAEAVYAQAELTVANAEAKLREANAALVLAQAETEKVRAELLKVQVALAEVTVEEEKVKLQLLEADLEKHLAEVEAAKAKAEAEKQGWINILNHAIADAERQAIADAEEILKAEQKLEEYLLTLAKDKADSAKAASVKYFAALDEVQNLQKEQLETKAMKALVEAGALQVREAIYKELGQIDEQIAINQARIDYLKEYQTKTPEEIEAEMEEAWKEVNDAYAVYMAAVEASDAAETAKENAATVKSTYVEDWSENFADVVRDALRVMPQTEYGQYGYSENYYVDEETGVKYNAYVKFDEKGNVEEIIPLWTASAPNKEQYFDEPVFPKTIDGIYQNYPMFPGIDLTTINNRTYYPAKIEFDNIQKVFTAYNDWQENVVLKDFDDNLDNYVKSERKKLEGQIDDWKVWKAYFEEYVAGREDMVAKAEQDFADSIAKANPTHNNFEKAWNAYRDYMVMKYDVDRTYFERRHNALKALDKADEDSATWVGKLTDAKRIAKNAWAKLEEAELLAHNKAGAFQKAKDGVPTEEQWAEAVAEARKKFNDEFSTVADPVDSENDTVWVGGHLFRTIHSYSHYESHDAKEADKNEARPAGSTQEAVYKAEIVMDEAQYALRDAQWLEAYWTGYGDATEAAKFTAKIPTLKTEYSQAVTAYNALVVTQTSAEKTTKDTIEKKTSEYTAYNAAKEAWEAAVAALYPHAEGKPDTKWDEWVTAVKDTLVKDTTFTEVALNFYPRENVSIDVVDTPISDNADPKAVANPTNTTYKVYTIAQKAAWFAHQHTVKSGALADAEAKLLAQLALKQNVDPEEIETTEDKEADRLYEAMLAAWQNRMASKNTMDDALNNLRRVYYRCADQDYRDWFENEFYWANATYQLDPDYQLISSYTWNDEKGTYEAVKSYRRTMPDPKDPTKVVGDRTHSFAALIEDNEAKLADKEKFAADCRKEYVKTHTDPYLAYEQMTTAFETATKNLAEYKAVETAYVNSVNDRNTTHAAWVEATLEELIADGLYKIEREEYLALKDLANEGIWVYDPERNICKEVYDHKYQTITSAQHNGEFTFVPIATEIEKLEGKVDVLTTGVNALFTIASTVQTQFNSVTEDQKIDIAELKTAYDALIGKEKTLPGGSIAELNFTKNILEQALKYGKIGLQIVVDAFDAEIAELEEKIEVYAKIAETYKAIMNAYLGIVDEADAEGETGPLDGEGEGDDEE